MVTIHRAFGFRFVIYTNDHAPAHVHVVGPEGEAKVQLTGADGLELIWAVGIKNSDLHRIMAEVAKERSVLLMKWQEIHG